jgi:ribosome-binding protein aMBF1 (putative translation factor)
MTKTYIPIEDVAAKWFKDPDFVAAYDALEEEFSLANTLIQARSNAHLTQEDLAKKMGTTQAVIARLESGRIMPSTRTLMRYAQATGTRLRVSLI